MRGRRVSFRTMIALVVLAAGATAGGSSCDDWTAQPRRALSTGPPRPTDLAKSQATEVTALIGSSGPAETNAVNVATAAWTKKTGIKVNVIVASDLGQQLAQGFASGNPPDIFYLGNDQVATYAKAGNLAPLDKLKNVKSFYPSLRAAYTYKGHLYAAPKDFSTLGLVINTASWKRAGLTDQELPEDVGAARLCREEADAQRPGRALHRPRVPPPRRLHDPERRLARLEERQDGRRSTARPTCRRSTT